MLAQAMAELMEGEELEDVLVYPNGNNENQPLVRVVKTFPDFDYLKRNGLSRYYSPQELEKIKKLPKNELPAAIKIGLGRRLAFQKPEEDQRAAPSLFILIIISIILLYVGIFSNLSESIKWFIMLTVLGVGLLYIISNATAGLGRRLMPKEGTGPKLIVDNSEKNTAPFVDATGARAGALLGDCKHDPLQSGGLGTPPHLRVEAGAIHQASKGVLFIDEIASLKMNWQQDILTAMQEKKYPITGQSEMSSGALVKTQPVPTDFVLVAAGNLPDMGHIHPALRSRIRGAGYEVYVEEYLDDTPENEEKLIRFIAQEIKRDGRIPHFDLSAIEEIIEEARRMSGRRKKFALNLRELGGLVRAAGDVAKERKLQLVTRAEVIESKKYFRSIESQFGEKMIERKKEYQTIITTGAETGRVNGLAVLGDARTGLVLPIVAEATPAASRSEGRVIATGKLGTIAKEAVDNVSALFKKYIGTEIFRTDLHIQYLQTYEGLEGDSASISTALAVISAISHIPVYQNVAMTGSLDVRGQVLPVGGVTGKIEAAIEAGIKKVLIPKSNAQDVYLSKENTRKIEIIQVKDIYEVLDHALQEGIKKKDLLRKIKRQNEN
ncbi:ATP-dependent protease LonB [Candidatus Micrarchaeota archaeon]|nr:ATP-dependent protease LonB [Candidatus Micrarchaeota archaeon]